MRQFKSQVTDSCCIWLKNIVVIGLFFSPCVFASELVNSAPSAGLIYQNKTGKTVSTPMLSTNVVMNVNGLINRVKVIQRFKNDSAEWINARYIFPLPENAAVDHLRMTIDKRVIIGEIKEKSIAKKIFNQAKNTGKKASLIEQQRNDIFTAQVANIGPGEAVDIEIEYQQQVDYKSGVFSLYYPMTITPRYAPSIGSVIDAQRTHYINCIAQKAQSQSGTQACEQEWNEFMQTLDAKQVAAETIQTIKAKKDPDILVNLQVRLHSPIGIENITSPYHAINVSQGKGEDEIVSLQGGDVIADRDFVLNWQVAQGDQAEASSFAQQKNEQTYAMLMLMPPRQAFVEAARISKEVIFVIDVSGSMSGTSIKQAKAALAFAVDELDGSDTFNIVAFNDQSRFFADNTLPADKRSKVMAKTFIDDLKAGGGTNMGSALSASLVNKQTLYENKKQGLRQVVFITDASISNEQQLLTQIHSELGESRLFMVGIGSAPNHYFMKSSATLGKGSYTQIGDVHEVKQKMSHLFALLSTPVLRNIKLNWADGSELDSWPKPVADLYLGEPLQISFKIPSGKKMLKISGERFVNNKVQTWAEMLDVSQYNNALGVDVAWAKTQINSIDLNRALSPSAKKNQITDLGLRFHIVTEHTSLVAVEQKIDNPDPRNNVDQQIKTHLPKGNTMSLPQTGTASDLYKNIGLLMLLLASLTWLIDGRHSRRANALNIKQRKSI